MRFRNLIAGLSVLITTSSVSWALPERRARVEFSRQAIPPLAIAAFLGRLRPFNMPHLVWEACGIESAAVSLAQDPEPPSRLKEKLLTWLRGEKAGDEAETQKDQGLTRREVVALGTVVSLNPQGILEAVTDVALSPVNDTMPLLTSFLDSGPHSVLSSLAHTLEGLEALSDPATAAQRGISASQSAKTSVEVASRFARTLRTGVPDGKMPGVDLLERLLEEMAPLAGDNPAEGAAYAERLLQNPTIRAAWENAARSTHFGDSSSQFLTKLRHVRRSALKSKELLHPDRYGRIVSRAAEANPGYHIDTLLRRAMDNPASLADGRWQKVFRLNARLRSTLALEGETLEGSLSGRYDNLCRQLDNILTGRTELPQTYDFRNLETRVDGLIRNVQEREATRRPTVHLPSTALTFDPWQNALRQIFSGSSRRIGVIVRFRVIEGRLVSIQFGLPSLTGWTIFGDLDSVLLPEVGRLLHLESGEAWAFIHPRAPHPVLLRFAPFHHAPRLSLHAA